MGGRGESGWGTVGVMETGNYLPPVFRGGSPWRRVECNRELNSTPS